MGWPEVDFTAGIIRWWRTSWSGACTVTVAGGALFGSTFHGAQMVKMTQLGLGLESSFLGFLELKMCLGG